MKIEYVLPTDEYAEYIADNLKGNDYIEVVGLVGRDVRREIKESIKASEWSRVWRRCQEGFYRQKLVGEKSYFLRRKPQL